MTYPDAEYSLFRFAFTRNRILFVFINAFCVGLNIYLPITDQWHWIVGVVTLATMLVYWIGNYRHRSKLKAMNAKPSGSPHYPEIAENSNPPQMTGGGPITNIVWWYAATRHVTREEAQEYLKSLEPMSDTRLKEIKAEHQWYLSQFKNK
jgi:hypothetical protein